MIHLVLRFRSIDSGRAAECWSIDGVRHGNCLDYAHDVLLQHSATAAAGLVPRLCLGTRGPEAPPRCITSDAQVDRTSGQVFAASWRRSLRSVCSQAEPGNKAMSYYWRVPPSGTMSSYASRTP